VLRPQSVPLTLPDSVNKNLKVFDPRRKPGVFFCYNFGVLERTEQKIEISHDQVSGWYPLIAVPCYDQQVTEPFFMSSIKMAMGFKEIGLNFAISTISDSLINRARNNLIAKFMSNPEFTHIMFIDADIGFDYEDIIKLLWHDKEIITGSYPIKSIRWDKVSDLVKSGIEPKDLMAKSLRYVVNPVKNNKGVVNVDNGAINIYDAGTGFMLIQRSVIEKMIREYPHLKFKDDTGSLSKEEKKWTYAFFNSYVDSDGRFLSEDYGFCRYWQDIDGDVWVDPSIDMLHLGRMKFEGRMMDFLETIVVPENG